MYYSVVIQYYLPFVPAPLASIPKEWLFSSTCFDFTLANVSMGEYPEFSANAIGIASKASA